MGQVLGYNNGGLTWTAPGGGVFSLNGTNAYYNGGNVGIGTNSPATKLEVNSREFLRTFHSYRTVSLGYLRRRKGRRRVVRHVLR